MQQQQQQQQQKCGKCGSDNFGVHLREVTVTIGWPHSRFTTVAPCVLCKHCGNIEAHYQITIGEYIDLEPRHVQAPPVPMEPQPAVQERAPTVAVMDRQERAPTEDEQDKPSPRTESSSG